MDLNSRYSRFLVPFLLLVIALLVVLNFYQNRVIQQQSFELKWLMTHSTITSTVPAKSSVNVDPKDPPGESRKTAPEITPSTRASSKNTKGGQGKK